MRWLCNAVLLMFFIVMLVGFQAQHGWTGVVVAVVFLSAVLGAAFL